MSGHLPEQSTLVSFRKKGGSLKHLVECGEPKASSSANSASKAADAAIFLFIPDHHLSGDSWTSHCRLIST